MAASAALKTMTISEALNSVQDYMQRGRWTDAENLCRQIIHTQSSNYAAWAKLGLSLYRQNKKREAAIALTEALKHQPNSIDIIRLAGLALLESGQPTEAINLFCRVIELLPADSASPPQLAEPHYDLGVALALNRQFDEAIAAYRKSLSIDPNNPFAWNNLGNLLKRAGHLADAIDALKEAIRLKPDWADAQSNLATTYISQGDTNSAEKQFDSALALAPDHPQIHYNHGVLLLLKGDFLRGLPEYEWRWKCSEVHIPTRFSTPPWRGDPLNGKMVMLHAEQGLGDTIQFARYVRLVQARGGKIVLCVQPEAVSLLKSIPGVQHVASHPNQLPQCDNHCYLMDLPQALGTTLGTIPNRVPYLHPDPALVQSWRDKLANQPGIKIGLAWAGRPTHANNANRSIDIAKFAPLAGVSNITFYSVQVGPGSEHVARTDLIDFTPQIKDLSDSAALLANLDLIITVDSAVAHLAGAIAKPVWIMLPFAPDWRWLLRRSDSPWYPTAKLFRQPKPGDWNSVIASIRLELEQLASSAEQK
jgi:Flp pilus assembly protein TadD